MEKLSNCRNTQVYFAQTFADLSDFVSGLGNNVIWICDSNTARMVRPLPEPNVVITPGPASKVWESVERVVSVASENYLTNECTFIALGGGVVCDVANFAAAVYKGGCRIVLLPTTLVAMADSSIGGFATIEMNGESDIISVIHEPIYSVICPSCLKSLKNKDISDGLGTIIKYACLSPDNAMLNMILENSHKIQANDIEILSELIKMSLKVKTDLINQGKVEFLNLGSIFCQAVFAASRKTMSYGQAMAHAISLTAEISEQLRLCDSRFAYDVNKAIKELGFGSTYKVNRGDWIEFKTSLLKQQARNNGELDFICLCGQGNPVVANLNEQQLKEFILSEPMK